MFQDKTTQPLLNCLHVCRVGAAISIESEPVPDVYSKLVYNPLCFLRYEDYIVAPDDWDDVRFAWQLKVL